MQNYVALPLPNKLCCTGCRKRFLISLKKSEMQELNLHWKELSNLTIEILSKKYNLTFLIYDWNRGEGTCASCGTVLNEPFHVFTNDHDTKMHSLDDDSTFTENLIPEFPPIQSKTNTFIEDCNVEYYHHFCSQDVSSDSAIKIDDSSQAISEKEFIISSIEEIAQYCDNSSSSINKFPKRAILSEDDKAKLEEKKSIIALSISVLTTLSQNFNLAANTLEEALMLFLTALSRDENAEITSYNYKSFVTACLYQTCKNQGIVLDLNQLSSVARLKRRQIWRKLESLRRLLGIKTIMKKPFPYLCKIINEKETLKMELSKRPEIIYLAYLIMKEAESKEPLLFTRGTSRSGHAAAALYLALKLAMPEKWTQEEIASAAEITQVTIRNRQREYKKLIGFEGLAYLTTICQQEYQSLGSTSRERWETFVKLLFLKS